MILGILGSTDSKLLGSDEGLKLGSTDVKVLCTILGDKNGIMILVDVGTDLGSIEGLYYGSNDVNIEGLLIGGTLRSTHGKVLDSDEGIKLVLSVV